MYKPVKQKHTEQMKWRKTAFVCLSPFAKPSVAASAAFLALVVVSTISVRPAGAESATSNKSEAAKPAKVASAAKKTSSKSSRKRRVSKSTSSHTTSQMTTSPHSDRTGSPNTDPEVTSVLKYGARKHAEGNYEEAEAAFRHVLSRDPANVDAFYDLGALAERKGDLISALSSYRAALALKPHDKEIAEAVNSIEKTLRNRPAFGFRENQRPVVRGPGVPFSSSGFVPKAYSGSGSGYYPEFAPPILGSAPLSSDWQDAPGQPPLVNSPQLGSGLSVDPAPVPAGTFQLSSAKNGMLAPTLGVTPASAAIQALPATPPVVGVAPRSHPVARQFLNTALNSGASIGLRAAGLHCPACHFLRFRF